MIFVDTNYFLRFLLKDLKDQESQAQELFEKGALNQIRLLTSTIVFFEVYWVISSSYSKKKPQIIPVLRKLLSMNFINYENADYLKEALGIYQNATISLVDAFNIVYAKANQAEEFKTFDERLEKMWNQI